MQGPATWDEHPRCQLARGEDAAVEERGNEVFGAKTAHLMSGEAVFLLPAFFFLKAPPAPPKLLNLRCWRRCPMDKIGCER